MHFSLSNSGRMSETSTAAELDFSEEQFMEMLYLLLVVVSAEQVIPKVRLGFKSDAMFSAWWGCLLCYKHKYQIHKNFKDKVVKA